MTENPGIVLMATMIPPERVKTAIAPTFRRCRELRRAEISKPLPPNQRAVFKECLTASFGSYFCASSDDMARVIEKSEGGD